MFTIFKEEKVITAGILVFLCLSVLVRLMLAWMYHTMIRETDNMATTGNRLLKQCKVKFANCYQLNGGVSNIPVFVDKFLNRLSFGHLSFDAWYHLSGRIPVTEQDYVRLYGAPKLPGRRTVELMPIRGRAAQPQEMVREAGREVFSAEHAIPGKTEDRGMSQQDESSSVTEEELQALLQELLTV